MNLQGNTILITGGSSGIGRGLAEALYQRGNQVIVTGRREERLRELSAAHAGMRYFTLDVTDPAAIRDVAVRAIAEFPALNCVFNNAGVQRAVSAAPELLDDGALVREVETNLLGPIRVTAAFLPHLRTRPDTTLLNVSSGLAFVPMARSPVYCATKAAIHSWTLSLRRLLQGSNVKVIELIPPYVATELGGPGKPATGAGGHGPMPLDAFLAETMKELETDADEIAIAAAKNLASAACSGNVRKVFASMNP
jgi:uncharacterized oxidoreductase